MPGRRLAESDSGLTGFVTDWRAELLERRRFLLGLAGGSLAALFPRLASAVDEKSTPEDPWAILAAVQEHLFPDEPEAPGARQMHALDYLRFVVGDASLERDSREFILKGAGWLQEYSHSATGHSFLELDAEAREQVLRAVERSEVGENWLSTLLLYVFEALLTDPVYGGNPDGVGWRWLQHRPGFPRPGPDQRYPELLKK